MTNSIARLALLSSASTAVFAALLPASASAQSTTCSQVSTTIACTDGATPVLTAITGPGITVVPGAGLVAVNVTGPSNITYTSTGPITTTGVRAVNLTSTGGALNFSPSTNGAAVNIRTIGGVGANGVTLNTTGQAATVNVGNISTTGASSFGVRSIGGTDLTLRTGDITTTGAASRGIEANNQTGVVNIIAGNLTTTDRAIQIITTSNATIVTGNISSGTSGVLVNGNNVNITTGNVAAANGFGVVGQLLAGSTGNVVIRTGSVTSSGLGFAPGVGGSAFNGVGSVNIGCGNVTSNSPGSAAVFAQNNSTGGLTINCGAVTSVGNNAVFASSSGAPNGGNIAITTTSAASSDNAFATVFARTSGTGTITINAGTVTGGANAAGVGAIGISLGTGTGAIDAGYGNVTTVGTALESISTGTLNLRGSGATLTTTGAGPTAAIISANGVTGNLGNITTRGLGAQGAVISSTAPVNLTIGNVATTGNGVRIIAGSNAVTLATGTVTATALGATGTVINATGPITFTGGAQTANGANALAINGGAGAINVNVAGATTTGTANAVNITGTGPLTFANSAVISTTGANSTGLNIFGVTTAAVSCGNVSTTGPNSPGVVVATNGDTNVACGTVTTTGILTDTILVINTAGTTTVTGGTTSATGAGSRGIFVNSSAPAAGNLVTVNTGVVTANGTSVIANSTGGANVLINANGNLTSTTGAGIIVTTAGGAATVNQAAGTTITAATDAIRVTNTVGGAINVNALGTLVANNGSGVLVSTTAASADPINVTTNIVRSTGGAGTWGSQVRASAGTGDITITSNGAMSSAGAPGSMFGGILALTNGTSNRNVTVNVNANIGSPTDLSSAAQVLISGTSSSAKTLAVNIANASIFGGPGAVQVQQSATSLGDIRIIGTGTGTLSAAGATGTGVTALILNAANSGNILVDVTQNVIGTAQGINASTLGNGTVTVTTRGNVTATAGTGITAASGGSTLVTIGAGTTTTGVQGVNLQGTAGNTLIVNGTLRNTGGTTPYTVRAGGPFTLTLGATGSIVGPLLFTTGNDTFNNQGIFALPATLDFLTGNDVLNNSGTLTAFTGTSTISNLETFNNVGGLIDMLDGVPNDIINLGNANFVGSGGSRLGLDIGGGVGGLTSDRLILGGNASGSTALNLNFLAGSAIVDRDGVLIVDAGTATGTPFTFAGPFRTGLINFALQQTGGDTFLVSTVDKAVFDSLAVNQMSKETAYQSIDAHVACSASRRSRGEADTSSFSLCGQLYASSDKVGGNRTASAFGTSLDFNDRRKTERQGAQLEAGFKLGGAFEIGLTGGYGHAETDMQSGSQIDINGHNAGVYAQVGSDSGLYAGLMGQVGRFDVRFGNGDLIPLVKFDGRTTAVDGEVGFRAGRLVGAALDAHVGLSWVRTRLDDFTTGNINFVNDKFTSYRGRAGARLTFDGAYAPFIDGKVYREFKGDGDVILGSGSLLDRIGGRGRGTWGRIEAGVAGAGMISAWVDVGDVKGWGVRAGFRF